MSLGLLNFSSALGIYRERLQHFNMNAGPHYGNAGIVLLFVVCCVLPSCGLVKMPFRVAGAVVEGTYVGGKKVANSTSEALEKRKLRKKKEEEEAARNAAKGAAPEEKRAKSRQLEPAAESFPVDQSPAIPVEDSIPIPLEPLGLPQ
jgi:hypothetical protein